MKDRKEYYKAYNSKCAFINLRFNLCNEDDYCLLRDIIQEAYDAKMSKSEFIKFILESYI